MLRGRFIAFDGHRRVATGTLAYVAMAVKAALDEQRNLLIFDTATAEQIHVDLSGSLRDVLARLPPDAPLDVPPLDPPPDDDAPRGRGRPKLGVTSREISLLPRQWEWLQRQPGGISGTLRRIVEAARKASEATDRHRHYRDTFYAFLSTLAGDAHDFEAASRALFAGDRAAFERHIARWPRDVRTCALAMAPPAFAPPPPLTSPTPEDAP